MQEHPAFVVFSKGEQGGAALVRSILNRAVGAPQDAVKQVRHHTHVQEDKRSYELCTTLRRGDYVFSQLMCLGLFLIWCDPECLPGVTLHAWKAVVLCSSTCLTAFLSAGK